MFKKMIAVLLSLVIAAGIMPALSARAEEEVYEGKCGENVYWSLDPDTMALTLTGTGEMEAYNSTNNIPWAAYREKIKTVEIKEGITNLTWSLFFSCNSLTECTVPASVTSIWAGAFGHCKSLHKVTVLNPECYIPLRDDMFSDAALCGYRDSTVYEFAVNQGNEFIDIETGEVVPLIRSNENMHSYINGYNNNWPLPIRSYLYVQDGILYRVSAGSLITVSSYDENYEEIDSFSFEYELPAFGGFYAGTDSNYLLYGQMNPDRDDSAEVFRLVRYDKNWNRIGSVSLYGANTTHPFEAGLARMTEYGGMLYVHTCHKMYSGHQANATFSVRTSDMTVTNQYTEVNYTSNGYASHSFNQFIMIDGTDLLTCSHSDAYPRAVVIFKDDQPAGQESYLKSSRNVEVLPLYGSVGNNLTGAYVGAFEASSSAYLIAGCSIPQDGSVTSNISRKTKNIFMTVTPKDSFDAESTEIKWITQYDNDSGISISNPYLVKISEDRFLLMWTEDTALHYCFMDGEGNAVSDQYIQEDISLSDCEPLAFNHKLIWFVQAVNKEPVFHEIDLDNPAALKTIPLCIFRMEQRIPKCSDIGYLEKVCVHCGKTIPAGTFPVPGHSHDEDGSKEPAGCLFEGITRLYGASRFETSIKIADAFKKEKGIDKFESVILTSGINFADALAGSYLSYVKNAPILLTADTIGGVDYYKQANEYIKNNLDKDGTVFVLGGTEAVSEQAVEELQSLFKVERIAGNNRFETNLRILETAEVTNEDILVCTALEFADSLSASAAKRPILLAADKLTYAQKKYLNKLFYENKFYIIGGENAVKPDVEDGLKAYGNVKRIAGQTRHETSALIAEEFNPKAKSIVLSYSYNFPDGLCGGPLAAAMNAPIILTLEDNEEAAAEWCLRHRIQAGYVTGGSTVISDEVIKKVFNLAAEQ